MFRRRDRITYVAGYFLIVLAGIVLLWPHAFGAPSELSVHFFDVGQGDAIFIQTPQGYQILIDGGPDATVLEKLSETMPWWDRSLDLAVLTHPDADHLAGLIDVLDQYEVARVMTNGVQKDTQLFAAWQEKLAHERAEIVLINGPKRLFFSDGVVMDALWPLEDVSGRTIEDPNDYAVVARLAYGASAFLFTGDIERRGEKGLVDAGWNLESDVLKVAHHGSKTSSSEALLRAATPEVAIISVGKENRYGHPSSAVVERIAAFGATVLRTDERGDIVLRSRGDHIEVDK